ncbi:MAG: ParB N-terminal domain-containing protein [Anaerolineales bacterium]|nr:ParB N-terminal domain-containing protein [Anaerolineales bacterium]
MKVSHPYFPEMTIVPLERVYFHEEIVERRAKEIFQTMQTHPLLLNPVIAMPLHNDKNYVVLDGAHRCMALRMMGCSSVMIQVAHPDRDVSRFGTWAHAITECAPAQLYDVIRTNLKNKLDLRSHDRMLNDQSGSPLLARLYLPDRKNLDIRPRLWDLNRRVEGLHVLFNACKLVGSVERIPITDHNQPPKTYDGMAGWIQITPLKLEEIRELVARGMRLPAGTTRVVLSVRVLQVNLPLEFLRSEGTLGDRSDHFKTWWLESINIHQGRYYEEPTYIFEK